MRTLLVALVLVAFVGCGGRNNSSAPIPETKYKAPLQSIVSVGDTLSATPSDTLRLGRMRSGEVISQSIGLLNNSTAPLIITRTETTCGCTDIDYPSQPIGVGDTARIAIRFDSQGFYGWQFKRVRLYTSAALSPITIYIEAEVE